MKFKRKFLPIIVALAIVCCLFGGIFGVDGTETQVARAEETISIYAETGESIAQGNTGYCYVYVDNTIDLASLTVAVHYDSQKMSVTGYYNQVSCSIYDASNNEGCLKFSYIFDAEGSETKTALFYFYYQINSDAEIGDTGFDVVVEEAYTTTLEVAPYSGSRCNFEIIEQEVVNECWIYGSYNISTSVKETFEIDYSLSNCYIASGSIDVKYDPELFEFVELTQGNFLNGKVVDVNSSQRGTISLSFLATEYNYYSDLVKVKFRTLKNETTTSQIQLQVNDLYNLELSPFSCSGYTTDVNVTFDNVYAEDAPSVILGASFLESTEQVFVTVLLEEGSRLGAGDFVLNFDTDDLEFVSYEKGFTPSFFSVNDKSVAEGVLKFSVISMTDIVDEQTVLTILFNAKRECVNKTSNITISGTGLTDSLTNGILLNFVDTTANIPLKHTSSANVVENNVAPTCTAAGSYDNVVYCATCYTELSRVEVVVSALGHDLIPHDSKEPTCAEIGWEAYETCSRCDYTSYQELPATGHTESAVVVENNVAPTCTATGSYDNVVYCATCDTELSRTTIIVDALGHDPVEHSAKAPTCTDIGWNTYVTCSRCEHTTYEEKSALGHDPVEHSAKAPTCTEIGWNAYVTCSRCDHTTYAEIPATGHSHSAVVTSPTCTTQGYTTHTCHCGDSYIDSYVGALGHEEVIDKAVSPTCTATGFTEGKHCSVCDEVLVKQEVVEALGHDEITHNAKTPTCTEIGWNAYVTCSRCDHTTYQEIPATGHSHNAVVTAPTCTEEGYTTYTCHCGDTYVANRVAAFGHTGSGAAVENTVDPTCTTDGSYDTVVYCGVCFEELSRDNHSISKLGHVIVSHNAQAPTCTEIGWDKYETCSRCDHTTYTEIPAKGHTESSAVVENNVAPTCTVVGSYDNVVYCSTCDAELSRDEVVVPALGHDLIPHDSKAPTCTTIGWNTYVTCSRCDHTTYAEITATGHKDANNDKLCDVCDASLCDVHTPSENLAFDEEGHWSVCSVCGYALEKVDHTYETATTAPTCLEKGYTTFTCHCGHSHKSNFVDASGHTKASAVIENKIEPTCVNNGRYEKVVYCSICGDEVSRERVTLYATGHDIVKHNGKAPTCTAIGWNEYETCSRCEYTTYEEKSALGHKPGNTVIENMVPATCSTSGSYDSVVYCSVCGDEILRENHEIFALGHYLISHPEQSPTCTEVGWEVYDECARCEYTTYVEIPALGHNLESHNGQEPTCTEIGWNAYATCSRCDYTTYTEIPTTGHTPSGAVIENMVAPGCTTAGKFDSVICCAVCDAEMSRTVMTIGALGHNHSSQWTIDKAPTCTADGSKSHHCTICGDRADVTEIPATDHSPQTAVVENNVAPTCAAEGSYDSVVYCSVCGVELSRETIFVDVIGHSHTPVVTAPTCTTGGYTTYTCHCGDSYVADEVSAMGHIFSEWIVSIAPTCTGAGEERRDCDNCDYYETRELAAVEHDYSDGGSCSMCGKLSGGAVAGIATGSAGAVSVGGFSLFWFVIRKKRFKIRLKK